MSYLAKPGSMTAHIFKEVGTRWVDGLEVRVLEALCPAFFPNPHEVSYWPRTQIGRRRRRVCASTALASPVAGRWTSFVTLRGTGNSRASSPSCGIVLADGRPG